MFQDIGKIQRMGRPSLNVKATVIRLSDGVRERIEALVGKNQMANFIREAIDQELKRREKGAPPRSKRRKSTG